MSYRELRDFTETLRSLGYPRIVSIENFRRPNFELVADCLFWLLHRYDPNASISDDISTEHARVDFLKGVGEFLATHARIKLNLKRLYAGDGYAVRELLKVATLLDEASKTAMGDGSGGGGGGGTPATAQGGGGGAGAADTNIGGGASVEELSIKTLDVKGMRDLSSSITHLGASLHESLGQETTLREHRQNALSRAMDRMQIERSVIDAMKQTANNVENVNRILESSRQDEQALLSKIEKRKAELDRAEKRLSTLKSVRPAYMDEYDVLSTELQHMYGEYMERHRNLMFLEKELEGHKMLEMEKMEEQNRVMKRMQRRLRDEELRILRGEQAMPGGRGEKAGGGKKELGMHKKFRLGLQGDPDSDDEDDGIDISRVGRGFDDDDDLADDNVSISDDDEEYGDNIDNDDDDDDNDGDLRRHDARPAVSHMQRRRSSVVVEDAMKAQEVHRKNAFVKGSMMGGGDDFDDGSDDDISDDPGHSDESDDISVNDGESSVRATLWLCVCVCVCVCTSRQRHFPRVFDAW